MGKTGRYTKDQDNCDHAPVPSHMVYKHEGKEKHLRLIFCGICGRTLRNLSWPERDAELITELDYKYLRPDNLKVKENLNVLQG